MGVTLAPDENREYCQTKGLREVETFRCCGEADCLHCKGEGEVRFETTPFEAHLSYGSICDLYHSIGLQAPKGFFGWINPDRILKANPGVYAHFNPGTADHILSIAQEAKRRGVRLYWS